MSDFEWQPMSTAPKDGSPIQAKIPGHGEDNIIAWFSGFYERSEQPASGWMMIEDQEPPDSWIDGICWRENEEGYASVEPIAWKQL